MGLETGEGGRLSFPRERGGSNDLFGSFGALVDTGAIDREEGGYDDG